MQQEHPDREFVFIADDWGSSIASQYAAKYNNRLNAFVQLDSITFDGYPVNEIQAIGRASAIPNTPEGDDQYAMLFAAFDQTLVQILKSMVYDPAKYNQSTCAILPFRMWMLMLMLMLIMKERHWRWRDRCRQVNYHELKTT